MKTLTIAEAVGYKLTSEDGSYKILSQCDPYSERFRWNGYDAEWKDVCMGTISWSDIKEKYGVVIAPTAAEQDVIARVRFTRQVEEKASALRVALEGWLTNEKAR